tara:strand:- start:546 stop:710 length:165 start_codon:yes stop_codon:yes gene_type:complete
MRLIMMFAFLFLTGCGYTVTLGKKCTPGHDEWSYVWFFEKDGSHDINKGNCRKE